MDTKILKHDIFTEECVFSDNAEVAIDTDFTLPDYYGEIKKILKCRAMPRIASKGVNGEEFSVDGAVEINLIYTDEQNNICSYTYLVPFNKSFDLKEDCSEASYTVTTKTVYMNCRALSVRKVDIHGAISVDVNINKICHDEVISDADGGGIEVLCDIAPATVPIGIGEKNLFIEEEFSLGDGQPDISCILRYDATPRVEECKIIGNKTMVKGKIRLLALYIAKGSMRPEQIEKIIPFSQLIDVEGINDDCECDCKAEIAFCELKARSLSEDENRNLLFTAKLNVCTNVFCNNDLPIIRDAYSTSNVLSAQSKTVSFKKIEEKIFETFYAKKALEFSDGAIGTVVDFWCETSTNACKIENKTLIVPGTVTVCGIICDTEGTYNYYERPVDFEYKYNLTCNAENPSCDFSISVVNTSYTITSATCIEIKLELCVSAVVYGHRDINLITDIMIDEGSSNHTENDSGVVVYFPETNESIWEIAKRYNSVVGEIKELNLITEDTVNATKGLIIPIKQ